MRLMLVKVLFWTTYLGLNPGRRPFDLQLNRTEPSPHRAVPDPRLCCLGDD